MTKQQKSHDDNENTGVTAPSVEDMDDKQLATWILDAIRRSIVHYGMWYTQVGQQLGLEEANKIEAAAGDRGMAIILKRLAKVLDFELEDGLPKPLLEMDRDRLLELAKAVSINWLVGDGVWFQAVESDRGMTPAKLCNDGCWAHFSPFEAYRIKQLLGLDEQPGLEGLAQALQFRLYGRINKQSIEWAEDGALLFYMNECRVQVARKRKGLADYPCKSAGLIEYPFFARAIDSRIVTEVIACPPDPHPEEWWCAWRFSIPGKDS